MTDLAIFYEADREFHDKFDLVNATSVYGNGGTLGVRVWKAQRTDGWKELVINCVHQYDSHNGHRIACYDLGGHDVGVFPVPPGEEAFGPWLADKISRSEELTHLHLLDPTGSIFCSQDFGEEFVALKTNLLDPTGQTEVPPGILREIDVLQSFAHRHVVRLLDVFCSPTKSTLVFELMESNLHMYMRRNGPLSPDSVKGFMKQLMLGMEHVHSCGVMHRDMGPQNLLVGEGANLKIGGFGLSRRVTIPGGVYTHEVIAAWYRPLEILLGDKTYNLSVDMWSCGCILGEMASNRPLFPGDSEIGVIFKIFAKLGTPTEQQWKGLENLPDFKRSFPKWSRTPLGADQDLFAQLGREGLELLEGLLQYDPAERTSARTALKLDYLSS